MSRVYAVFGPGDTEPILLTSNMNVAFALLVEKTYGILYDPHKKYYYREDGKMVNFYPHRYLYRSAYDAFQESAKILIYNLVDDFPSDEELGPVYGMFLNGPDLELAELSTHPVFKLHDLRAPSYLAWKNKVAKPSQRGWF